MCRIHNPDLAHVLLEDLEFIVERDQTLHGTWNILAIRNDAPGTSTVLGAFLAVRQARHGGYTVWTTADSGRRIGFCDSPISACDEILRHGIDVRREAARAACCDRPKPRSRHRRKCSRIATILT